MSWPAGQLPAWGSTRREVNTAVPILAVIAAIAAVLALQHSGNVLLFR
ncbi:hypothetical protein [Streptomyces avermitilis]